MADLSLEFVARAGAGGEVFIKHKEHTWLLADFKDDDSVVVLATLNKVVEFYNAGQYLELVKYVDDSLVSIRRYNITRNYQMNPRFCPEDSFMDIAIWLLKLIVVCDKIELIFAAQHLYKRTLCCGAIAPVELPSGPSYLQTLVCDITKYILRPMLTAAPGEFVPHEICDLSYISFYAGDGVKFVSIINNTNVYVAGSYENGRLESHTHGSDSFKRVPGDDDEYLQIGDSLWSKRAKCYVLPNWPIEFTAVCGGYAYGKVINGPTVRVRISPMCWKPCECCPAPVLEPTRVENPIDSITHYYATDSAVHVFYYGATAPHMIIPSTGMRSFGRMPIGDEYYILDDRGFGTIAILH